VLGQRRAFAAGELLGGDVVTELMRSCTETPLNRLSVIAYEDRRCFRKRIVNRAGSDFAFRRVITR